MKRGEPNHGLFAPLHLQPHGGADRRSARHAGCAGDGQPSHRGTSGEAGAATLLAAESGLQDDAASKAREVLRKIPDGVYEFWDFLDDDMVTGIPIRVRLRMAVSDGLIDLDMSGSDRRCARHTMYRRWGDGPTG